MRVGKLESKIKVILSKANIRLGLTAMRFITGDNVSQRLLVTANANHKDKDVFDGICLPDMTDDEIDRELWNNWISYSPKDHGYFSPFKVSIEDITLFGRVQEAMRRMFTELGKDYPECIWIFFKGKGRIEHPTDTELSKWLKAV